jgi:autotransporter-associated beta strand protein
VLLTATGTYANNYTIAGLGAPETAGQLGAIRFGNSTTISGNITLSDVARLTAFSAAETGTVTGVISGAFSLEKTGAGVLVFGGASANTYTGDTNVTGGTLRAGKTDAFGPVGAGRVMVASTGAVDLNNQNLGTKLFDIQGAGSGTGAILNSNTGVTFGLQRVQLSADASIGGTGRWDIRGGGSTLTLNNFNLTKTGTNLISLVGTTVSAGNIIVNQGQLGIEAGTNVPAAAGKSITVNPGAALWVHDFGTAISLARDIVLAGGELVSNATGANGNSVIASNVAVNAASNITVADVNATMQINGGISGAAAFTKTGNGTLRLDGAIGAAIPTITITGGKLLLNGAVQGATAISATAGTITFGASSGIGAGGSLTLNGAELDQSAAGYTFSGNRTLTIGRSGTPAVDARGNITAGAGATIVVGGAASAKTATFANNLTLSGAAVNFDLSNTTTVGSGVNDYVNVAGTLDVSGGGITLGVNLLNGSYANGSYTLFTAGTLIGNASNFVFGTTIPNTRQTLTIDTTTVANTVLLTAAGSPAKSLIWAGGSGGNAWDINTTQNWVDGVTPDVFYNLDTVTFDDSGAAQNNVVLNGTLLPAATIVNSTATYTFSGSGKLSGSGPLTKTGNGTLILTTANDTTGTATINGGTLQIGNGGTTGTLGSGPVVNNATLAINRSDSPAFTNVISGTGALVSTVNGTLTLGNANTYTGATTVNGGVLSVATLAAGGTASSIGAASSAAGNLVLNGATLLYTGAAATTDRLFSIGASGATLNASGAGALVFSNTGALGFSGTGSRTLTLGGTNTGANQINVSITDDPSGLTSLVKTGTGTWILNGANSFTGGVTVNGGTLAVDGSQVNNRVPAGNTVAIASGGIFEVRGVNAIPGANPIAVQVAAGGILRVVSGGSTAIGAAGTSHSHLGSITLTGGTVELTYSGAGAAYDSESFQLDGDLFVSGSAPSLITTTAATTQQGISLNSSRTFNVADVTNSAAVDLTVDAEIENRDGGILGTLVKDGAGTLLLSRANSHSGGTSVVNGVLRMGIAGSLGAGPVNISGTGQLDPNGIAFTNALTIAGSGPDGLGAIYNSATTGGISPAITSLTLSGNATIGGAGQRWDIGSSAAPVTINGGTFSLTKTGPSNIWFRGSASSTLGNLIVNGGVFGVETNSNTLGNTGRAYVNAAGTLSMWGDGTSAITQSKPITLNGGTLDNDWGGAGTPTWSGDVQLTADSTLRNDTAVAMALTGPISGSFGFTVAAATTAPIELSGTNTYSGSTIVAGNVLRAGSTTAFSPASSVSLTAAGSTLRLNGFNNTIAGLSGVGVVDNTSGTAAVLTVANATNSTFDGNITDNGAGALGLTKSGNGRLTLNAFVSYSGTTTVNAGVLQVNGGLGNSSALVNGGTLTGSGSVRNLTVNASGTLAPGNGPGTFYADSTTFNGGTFAVEIANAFTYDRLVVTGALTLASDSPLFLDLTGYTPAFGDSFTLIDNDGADTLLGSGRFTYNGTPILPGSTFLDLGGLALSLDYAGGTGNDVVLNVVPEPGSVALLLGGLAFLTTRRRRQA